MTTCTFKDALEVEFLVLEVGTLSEIMLRSIAEQDPVLASLEGLALRLRDLELEGFEAGLLKDFLEWDRSDLPKEPLLFVFFIVRKRLTLFSSSDA